MTHIYRSVSSESIFEPEVKVEAIPFYHPRRMKPEFVEVENSNPTYIECFETEQSTEDETSPSSKPKSLKCQICGKILSSQMTYNVHMKQHSNSKPYKCPECDVAFCHKPYLEVHLRTHTGEKPFECRFCKKCFSQKSSLNTHIRSHTGERPYSCDLCDKRFSVKSYVTAHRMSHIGQMFCEYCNVTFLTKSHFASHMKSHSSSNNFTCNNCEKTFSKESYLHRHQNICGTTPKKMKSTRSSTRKSKKTKVIDL